MNVANSRHYIVVVHGIGEQKLNQTATPVVHRFAEVRQQIAAAPYKHLVPAYLSAQSVRKGGKIHGWSEFRGIPTQQPTAERPKTFDGTPATVDAGTNFRFVDLHWQDLLRRHQERYASPVETWTSALMARLADPNVTPNGWLPDWALPLLRSVQSTAVTTKKILAYKYPELAHLIFRDFLGDVHLYGDYARTRGRAVRQFHVVLDEIMVGDFIQWCHHHKDIRPTDPEIGYQKPQFTVIAHSLGSIMSFDAIVYAHAAKQVRAAESTSWAACPSLPFLGYTYDSDDEQASWSELMDTVKDLVNNPHINVKQGDFEHIFSELAATNSAFYQKTPYLLWRDQLKLFITLGSPIDKYHVIWRQKYLHMGLPKVADVDPYQHHDRDQCSHGWLDDAVHRQTRGNIIHYNLCDEQDPVGHHLDLTMASDNYRKIFATGSNDYPARDCDVVFRRYSIPGAAHNEYWNDRELFEGIVNHVIGNGSHGKPEQDCRSTDYFSTDHFRGVYSNAYQKALNWAYFRTPFGAAILTSGLLSYAVIMATPFYRFALVLVALLLWVQPKLNYQQEAEPNETQKKAILRKIPTIRKGILAFVVSAMVEWRRILINLNKPVNPEAHEDLKGAMPPVADNHRKQFVFAPYSWSFIWRYLLRLGIALIIGSMLLMNLNVDALGINGSSLKNLLLKNPLEAQAVSVKLTFASLIFILTYLATMIYVAVEFFRHKGAKGGSQLNVTHRPVASSHQVTAASPDDKKLDCMLCHEAVTLTAFSSHLHTHVNEMIQQMREETSTQRRELMQTLTSRFDDLREELKLQG